MAFKFVALFALVAVASAGVITHDPHAIHYSSGHLEAHQPHLIKTYAAPSLIKHVEYEHEAPAHYDFSYSVHDGHSGDIKSQTESRKGDAVHGQYSLIEADGLHRRVVDYTADAHHGFNAQVRHEPIAHKAVHAAPLAVHHAAPVAVHHAAPIAVHHAVPIAVHHAAPVAVHHAAPVAHYATAHHAAPVAHYTTAHHAAPIAVHHAAPVAHYTTAHHAAPVAHYSTANLGHSQVVHHGSAHNDYHHHY